MSTTKTRHLTEDQLRRAMGVVESASRLNAEYRDLPDEELRQKVADVMLRFDKGELCFAEYLPIPDRARHDMRASLATLGRLNGWTIPEEWECPDR